MSIAFVIPMIFLSCFQPFVWMIFGVYYLGLIGSKLFSILSPYISKAKGYVSFVQTQIKTYVSPTAKKLLTRTRGGRRLAAAVPESVASYVVNHFDAPAVVAEEEGEKKQEEDNKKKTEKEEQEQEKQPSAAKKLISSSSALIADLKSKLTAENARCVTLGGITKAANFSRGLYSKVSSSENAQLKKAVTLVEKNVSLAQQISAPYVARAATTFERFAPVAVSAFAHDAVTAAGFGAAPVPVPAAEEEAVVAAPAPTPVAPPLPVAAAAAAEEEEEKKQEEEEEVNEPAEVVADEEDQE